ncbi:MAG: arginine decarboxylase, pyruvoyl-dependent [Polyangiaceae bacterium]|nr:arginine decarboxylase, pyruvoyl-dependent [Polyangiaceae bacterium]
MAKTTTPNKDFSTIRIGDSGYPVMSEMLVPKAVFFTNGVGVHKDRLSSFELALRNAGIEKANLVTVSSIFPPHCREISRKEGQKYIMPGQIVHCVMARQDTNEPNRLIAASIGLARPSDPNQYGYLSEHHSYGETAKKAGEYAEDLAATMLATTLGIDFDPEKAWNEREQSFKMEKSVLKTRNVVQSAEGHAKGMWSTVVALGVFIF